MYLLFAAGLLAGELAGAVGFVVGFVVDTGAHRLLSTYRLLPLAVIV
jgi:hypothetical protein